MIDLNGIFRRVENRREIRCPRKRVFKAVRDESYSEEKIEDGQDLHTTET